MGVPASRRGTRVAVWVAVAACVVVGVSAGVVVEMRGDRDAVGNGGGRPSATDASGATGHSGAGGAIETGATVATADATIGPEGGSVELEGAADVDGFELIVPAGAVVEPTPISVEAVSIESIDAGPFVSPISPLFTVHAGDADAVDVIEVTVPVVVPDGWVAMGFFVDPATGELEGMPLLRADGGSITVGTRHFSSFFVSAVLASLLPATVTTGFDPTADTWQFPNQGTAVSPGGHCAGMALTEMWFFLEQRPTCDCHLRGRYDDATAFAVGPATPTRWVDDVRGLRWASSVQQDVPWGSAAYTQTWKAMLHLDASLQLAAFRYSMAVTGEPQLVILTTDTRTPAHAIVAYAVDGSTIHVADPNSPSRTDTVIEYREAEHTFAPFDSAVTADSPPLRFTRIGYAAKSALFTWDAIGTRFAQAESGTIGLDRFSTPDVVAVELTVDGIEDHRLLADGYLPQRTPLPVYAAVTGVDGRFRTSLYLGTADAPIATAEVTMAAGSPVPTTGTYALIDLAAAPQIGVLVEQAFPMGVDSSGATVYVWRWLDFQWRTIGAVPATTVLPGTTPQAGTTYDCSQPRPPGGIGAAEWDLHCGGPIGAATGPLP